MIDCTSAVATCDNIKYAFAAFCLIQAIGVTILTFITLRLANASIPTETLGEPSYVTINREGLQFVDQRIALIRSQSYTIYGQALTIISLVSGLVINFPWFFATGVACWIVLFAAAAMFTRQQVGGVKRLALYRKQLALRVEGGFLPIKALLEPEIAFVLGLSNTQWKDFEAKHRGSAAGSEPIVVADKAEERQAPENKE